jgi:alpha-galactosidase
MEHSHTGVLKIMNGAKSHHTFRPTTQGGKLKIIGFVGVTLAGLLPQSAALQNHRTTSRAVLSSTQESAIFLAKTPPMGWNSWDSYGLSINEKEFKANADWMAQHLKTFGWEYVVIDEGWFLQNPLSNGEPAWLYTLDGHSRFLPAPNRFPSAVNNAGFRPLADYVHALGLKFGLHILRGIPRQAVTMNMPIADSPFHAADAADKSDTCSWNTDNFGVRDNMAGQAYYESVAQLYATWGVDFVKVDCISSRPYKAGEIRMIAAALSKSRRPMILSLSPGPTSLANAADVRQYAQMWRISDDFWDLWRTPPDSNESWAQTLYGQFATAIGWASHIEPGHWPDADMLPIGYIGPRPGLGKARQTRFTHDEQRTLITLWAIARSPLIMGGNLTQMDDWTTSLLSNPEVIEIDQHSTANQPLIVTNDTVIWAARSADGTAYYLAIFNRSEDPKKIELGWNEVGLVAGKPYRLRDIWEHKDLNGTTSLDLSIQPHGCALYRLPLD